MYNHNTEDDLDLFEEEHGSDTPQESLASKYFKSIGGSKVDILFSSFDTSSDADVYRGVQNMARSFGEHFADLDGKLNSAANDYLNKQALQLSSSASDIRHITGRRAFTASELIGSTRADSQVNSGFYSRPGVREYSQLVGGEGFKGVFFQLQNQAITSELLKNKSNWEVLTQETNFNNIYKDSEFSKRNTAGITAPNDLTLAALNNSPNSTGEAYGIQSFGSFHPKVGFNREFAFIGTQNITPALSRKGTLESLLVFERNSPIESKPSKLLENRVANELTQLTETFIGVGKQTQGLLRPGVISKQLQQQDNRQFVYVNSEILTRVQEAISIAASPTSKDKVVISMGEISLLLKSGSAASLKESLAQIADSGRLSIVTDERTLNRAMTTAKDLDTAFIERLSTNSSLVTAVTGFQHEKSIAIFGESNDLRFISLGSANMSSVAMLPINRLDPNTQAKTTKAFGTLSSSELLDTINTEANVIIGDDTYKDASRGQTTSTLVGVSEYLDEINRGGVFKHFDTISQGKLTGNKLFNTSYPVERDANGIGVELLGNALTELNQKAGYSMVEVNYRYGHARAALPTGLRVSVQGLAGHRLSMDLTVNQEGNVINADYNRVINGALFVNKSNEVKQVAGRKIIPGQSTQLSGIEAAVGIVGTAGRVFAYEAQVGLTNKVFESLVNRDSGMQQVTQAAKKVLAGVMNEDLGYATSAQRVNLASLFSTLQTPAAVSSAESQLLLKLASGDYNANPFKESLTSEQIQSRIELLEPVMRRGFNKTVLSRGIGDTTLGAALSQALRADTEGVLNDIKFALIQEDSSAAKEFTKAAATQSRTLISDLLAPYLAVHERDYSSMQAAARLPVYGESENFNGKPGFYNRIAALGLMNPLKVGHGTRLGEAGQYGKGVGSVSKAAELLLPGYGGINHLLTVDSDISTGAVTVDDMKLFMSSTAGLTYITPEANLEALIRAAELTGRKLTEEELAIIKARQAVLMSRPLYALPFPKAEQIPQRLKNVKGIRPAIEVNSQFAESVRNLQPASIDPKEYIAGRLRESLPAKQFGLVRAALDTASEDALGAIAEDGWRADIEAAERVKLTDNFNNYRGLIGDRSMKRVAIQAGSSLMSDFAYGNAAYQEDLGSIKTIRVKVHQDKIDNPLGFQAKLSQAMAKGNIVTTQLIKVQDENLAAELLTLNKSREGLGHMSRDFIVKGEDAYYKEGLYTQEGSKYKRIGAYTEDGLIRVFDLATSVETHLGRRTEPLLIKFGAFGKRYEGGVSVITETPSLPINASGTLVAEVKALTIYKPGSNSRSAGLGAAKAPILYVQEDLFKVAEQKLGEMRSVVNGELISYQELIPKQLQGESLYQMRSFSLFKGYNYETGLYLLSQQDSRQKLTSLSPREITRAAALLFIKDKEIKTALAASLRQEGLWQAAAAVKAMGGFDISTVNASQEALLRERGINGAAPSIAGQTAAGLLGLADDPASITTGDLSGVKQLVLEALQNNKEGTAASRRLATRAKALMQEAATGKDAILFSDGNSIINEGSAISKSGGLLSHMLFLNRQLFIRRTGAGLGAAMLERSFTDIDKYYNDPAHRTFVDMVASTAGLPLGDDKEQVIRRLKILQATLGQGHTMENIVDLGMSKSLVPSGMQDQVKMEFQYLMGLTTQYLKPFERIVGKDSASMQHTYLMLSAVASGQRLGLPSAGKHLAYKVALVAPSGDTFINRQELHLRRLLLANTPVTESLFGEALSDLALNQRGGRKLGTIERASQIATGILAEETNSTRIRATELARPKRLGLPFFTNSNIQSAELIGIIGAENLAPRLVTVNRSKVRGINLVAEQLTYTYSMFIAERELRRKNLKLEHSFTDFVNHDPRALGVKHLQQQFHILEQIAPKGNVHGIAPGADIVETYKQFKVKLEKVNNKSIKLLDESVSISREQQYLKNLLAAETQLIAAGTPQAKVLLSEVQQTKQLVLPAFTLEPIEPGKYRLSFKAPEQTNPTSGFLLGADILANASLVFGDYTDEILTGQVKLATQIIENQALLAKAATHGSDLVITHSEASRLHEYKNALEISSLANQKLLETDLVRKAYGDYESFKGAVGIAVSSFALDPDQIALGHRYESLSGSDYIARALENQVNLAVHSGPNHYQALKHQLTGLINDVVGHNDPELQTQVQARIETARNIDKFGPEYQQAKELVHAAIYSKVTGISEEEVIRKRLTQEGKKQIESLVALSVGGGVRRSGAPAGVSAMVGENINYSALGASAFNNLSTSPVSNLLRVDESRFKTGMILPAISRLLAGLGDHDGDAFQLMFSRYGELAKNTTSLQEELIGVQKNIKRTESLIAKRTRNYGDKDPEPGYTNGLHTTLQELRQQEEEVTGRLTANIHETSAYRLKRSSVEQKAIKDVRSWAQKFLALPDVLVGKYGNQEGISTGKMISLISQKFSMDGVSDAAPHIQQAERNIETFGKLFDTSKGGFSFGEESLAPEHISKYVDFLQQSSSLNKEELHEQVSGVLEYARDRVTSASDYHTLMTEYFAGSANLATAMDSVSGSIKKAAGSVLNMFEFEGTQALIGKGGTELIGKTYNAFVPMLDQASLELSIASSVQQSQAMRDTLKSSLGEANPLYQKLTSPEFAKQTTERYQGVTGVLGAMQQLIRDALKSKEGGTLQTILNRPIETEHGRLAVGEYLDLVAPGENPQTTDRKRIEVLRSVLGTTLGPVIKSNVERNPFFRVEDGVASKLRRHQPTDPGVTGFGALLDFADYTTTPTEKLGDFIKTRGLEDRYQSLKDQGLVTTPDDFVSKYMHGLLERTQASYLADTISPQLKETLVENAISFRKHVDSSGEELANFDRGRYLLTKEYEQLHEQGIDREQLNNSFVEEMILTQVREGNKLQHVLTPETLKDLRDKTQAANSLKYGLDVTAYDSIENRMELGNAMTYNAYIRRMRRGQHLDASEAMYATTFKLNYINESLTALGLDPDSYEGETAKEKALLLAGMSPFNEGALTKHENKKLIKALIRTTPEGTSGFEQLRETSAAINRMTGYLEVANQVSSTGSEESTTQLHKLTERLAPMFDGRDFNVDRLQELMPETVAPTPAKVREVQEEVNRITKPEVSKPKKHEVHLKHSPGLELLGVVASPFLIALTAKGLPVDERLGMFAVDTLQAVAQNTADSSRLLSKLGNETHTSTAAAEFQRARIRQSIQQEGIVAGTLQAIAQETMFHSLNSLSHSLIDRVVNKTGEFRTTGRALATVGAEILSTVLSQSAARAIAQKRSAPMGGYTPDLVSRVVQDFTAQVWKAAEELQLAILNPDYELVDTDESTRMDFETSAIPSEQEQDIESGLVVLDMNDQPIATEFDSTANERAMASASVSSLSGG